jgi:hypothetical protein
MFTKQILNPSHVAISGALLASILAVTSARAADQTTWLQEQLAKSDGSAGSVYVKSDPTIAGAAGPRGDKSYRVDAKADEQFAFVQRQLRKTDGSNE